MKLNNGRITVGCPSAAQNSDNVPRDTTASKIFTHTTERIRREKTMCFYNSVNYNTRLSHAVAERADEFLGAMLQKKYTTVQHDFGRSSDPSENVDEETENGVQNVKKTPLCKLINEKEEGSTLVRPQRNRRAASTLEARHRPSAVLRHDSALKPIPPENRQQSDMTELLTQCCLPTPKSAAKPMNIQDAFRIDRKALREGYLWKLGGGLLSRWKSRYCVLTQKVFSYYGTRGSSKLKGCIPLRLTHCRLFVPDRENPTTFRYC